MIEAGHFVEVENILRLTLRETMLVRAFFLITFPHARSDEESLGAEMIKYPQISTISLEIKLNKKLTR